jgi:hypothetical protein
MKFDCGATWETKHRLKQRWHRWFAWRPVRVADHDCRWMEMVERKGHYWFGAHSSGWNWSYREARR